LIWKKRLPALRKRTIALLLYRKDGVQWTKQAGNLEPEVYGRELSTRPIRKLLEKAMLTKTIWSGVLFFWKPSQIDWDKRRT